MCLSSAPSPLARSRSCKSHPHPHPRLNGPGVGVYVGNHGTAVRARNKVLIYYSTPPFLALKLGTSTLYFSCFYCCWDGREISIFFRLYLNGAVANRRQIQAACSGYISIIIIFGTTLAAKGYLGPPRSFRISTSPLYIQQSDPPRARWARYKFLIDCFPIPRPLRTRPPLEEN